MLYDHYRAIHIVFDYNDTDSKNDFDIIKDIRLNKINMEVRVVLLDNENLGVNQKAKINV